MAAATSRGPGPGQVAGRALFEALPAGSYHFRLDGVEASLPPLEVVDDDPELTWLARDQDRLVALSRGTGGVLREIGELSRLVERIEPVQRVERRERTWRAWTSGLILALVAGLLAIEWVWRKLAGLV